MYCQRYTFKWYSEQPWSDMAYTTTYAYHLYRTVQCEYVFTNRNYDGDDIIFATIITFGTVPELQYSDTTLETL